jgi:hypothetical protein
MRRLDAARHGLGHQGRNPVPRIKVYPEAAPWNGLGQERGVRTGDVTLRDGEVVYFFVERHLSDSGILVTSG